MLVGSPGANAAYTYRTEDLHDATVSYAAPSISGIATADGTAITMLPTIGGTTMVVAGANFGAADDLASVSVDMHANQGDGDGWVDLEDCAITVDHTEITCVLPERGGVDYHWRATRAGLTSDASTVLTKYAPPTVTGVLQMRHLPYSSPALGTDVLRLEDERLQRLEEEEKASPNYKDQAARKARTKIINFDGYKAHPKITNVSAKFVFEYNTVEGLLLSCSVLICLFGVMLDSDYLEDGKHKSVREAITILTLFIISVSLAYFGAVIWHEIVSELFPFLKCTPCLENRVQVKERASTFDKNIELAEGNFNRRAARPEKVQDADLMSVEEQLQMKALLAKMQDENRALKKDLAAASKDDAKTATKVVKKKKGFANVFSSSSKTVAHRGSAAMDGASGFSKDASEQIATPTAASNPMMFKKPSATTPKPPKPAPASPKPPPAPTP